jgi:hypothetical protein
MSLQKTDWSAKQEKRLATVKELVQEAGEHPEIPYPVFAKKYGLTETMVAYYCKVNGIIRTRGGKPKPKVK